MRAWLILLGGMLVWTAHFFALYALGSVLGTTVPARIGTGLLTLAAIGANLFLLVLCLRLSRTGGPSLLGWPARVGAAGVLLSLAAVFWQGLPAVTG